MSILGAIGGVFAIVVVIGVAFCMWLVSAWSKPGEGPP